MPRLRRSKPSADVSVSTPTSPTELVRNLTSLPQGDSRALVASSTAVALSVASAFYDTRDTSGDEFAVRRGDTGWETAYSAARMAVEIAKESSDLFLPLKAVAGAMSILIKNYDQTSDNAETVNEIERRVQSLSGVLASPVNEGDYTERGRRAELRGKLESVVMKLEPLADQDAVLRFFHNVNNAKTLMGFVQELADAITDYQVSVQQGVYERTGSICNDTKTIRGDVKTIHDNTKGIHGDTKNILEVADLELLEKLKPVHNAGYQAGHHDRCLPGTRELVLQDIMFWARNPSGQNVFWLNGLAGTGKSTITQSFSEMVTNEGLLGASFFCSRDYLDRKALRNIFPTLAYQLACRYPHFRAHIITELKKDPTLSHSSLISQLENLLVNPLSERCISCVIVIDALDECTDDQPASAILSVLGRFVKQLPLVKFFITGRPEPRIRTGFRLPLLEPLTQIFLLHEVDPSSVNNDIQLYLTQRLTAIAKQRSDLELPSPWPHNNEIVALTKKSSGLFIFASTLVRFIESEHHEPNERLQLITFEANNTAHEGRAGIDSLYSQILLHAFSDVYESRVFDSMRCVLGAIVLAFNPLSRRELSTILGVPPTLISTTLRHLHSVILVPTNEFKKIRIFHKSFPDFLQDRERCMDTRFHIDPATHHSGMVLSSLELVKELRMNPCSLPPFMMNQDALDLPQLLENKLGGALRYACSYWAMHLGLSLTSGDNINKVIASVTSMFESAPVWIEVLSLENRLEEVIHSMNSLLDWLENVTARVRDKPKRHAMFGDLEAYTKVAAHAKAKAETQTAPLHNLAIDCLRFTMHFFHPIQQCAQQVYHTAIPLSPTSSQLHQSCLQSVMHTQLSCVAAFSGAPITWGMLLRTIDVRPREPTCVVTSVQRIISVSEDIVNIYDAVTGILQQSLCIPEAVIKTKSSLDGSILFFAHSSSVSMWDVQTGGLIHTFTTQSEINDITVSESHIACGLSSGFITFWNIHTKRRGRGFGNNEPVITIYWLSSQELAVVTQGTFYIYDIVVGITSRRCRISGHVWGMVHCAAEDGFLIGTSQSTPEMVEEHCFVYISHTNKQHIPFQQVPSPDCVFSAARLRTGQLLNPMLVGKQIVCITQPIGVQSYDIESRCWTNSPPLLDRAVSMAVSLNRNLVVQTKHCIQIFSIDILMSNKTHNDVHPSHIYPLGEKHIVCLLQPDRNLALLKLENLQELHPNDDISPLRSLLADQSASACASSGRGLVAGFGISAVVNMWSSGTLVHEQIEATEKDAPLCGWSPKCTQLVTVCRSPQPGLCLKDAKHGIVLANLPLDLDDLGMGEVYDLTFISETEFYLKIDGPGQHIQIPFKITTSQSGQHSHKIIKGKPEPLLEPREMPPYSLDVNCEWIIDAKSRKVCWISPGNLRKGNGGHFWAGLSLVMIGSDGVVRKLTFKKPDY